MCYNKGIGGNDMDEFYYQDLKCLKDDLKETILFNKIERLTIIRDICIIYLLLVIKYNDKKHVREYFLKHTKKYYKEVTNEQKILKYMKRIINSKENINVDQLDEILDILYDQYIKRYNSYEKVFGEYEEILAYNILNDYNYKVLDYESNLNLDNVKKKINS